MKHTLFILVGASGSGKTTFGEVLRSIGVNELVSHTTRPKRTGEIDGTHYHFCNREEFLAVEMVESSSYPSSGSRHFYGTSSQEIREKLGDCHAYAVLDRTGATRMKELYPDQTRIVFMDITEKVMEERLRKRGDDEENIQSRLAHARQTGECEHFTLTDYKIQPASLGELQSIAKQLLFTEHLLSTMG